MSSNVSGFIDCFPSHSAFAGLLCTSIISPSAPTAIAAFANGSTKSRLPVACDGSIIIGKCDFSFITGTALKSNVFLVAVSNVLIPLSQSITFSFPPAIIYSALISHSSIVELIPLFNNIGVCVLPTSFNKSKFCIFLAPICITSTSSTNLSKYAVDINSVTIGSPVSCFAIFNNSNPSNSSPWKLYGEVLGLNAPPLKKFAPDAFTAFATSTICFSLSTEQGPAIIPKYFPPTLLPFTSTIVSAGWNNLFAFLYGSVTFITFST